ncbi:hypothetical protein [Pseudomonas libanensis]|uniref:Phage abortive infection protein n=1 Tax=Pseudomonas libanensis TaxID=75588 RepID=A0ABR5M440_9PSED|nr:hypothetical protein [Pseudomonas libanensis]KPG72879.1 hypothetical protein AEQ48_20445 [Pseudomonas libanensis]
MRGNSKKIILIFAATAGVSVFLVWGAYALNFPRHISTSQDVWAQFGDYFGGILNPLLSFFALLALLATIQSQQHERDEADRRHKAQMFDTRLFQLLSLSHDAVASIKYVHTDELGLPIAEFEGHRAVAHALNRLQDDYLYTVTRVEPKLMYHSLHPVFLNWKAKYWSGVASYVESMLFVLWYAIDKPDSKDSSQFALRATFSQMSADEKLLLFYVMIFSPNTKILLQGDIVSEFLAGATQDDLLLYRDTLLQSAVLARISAARTA